MVISAKDRRGDASTGARGGAGADAGFFAIVKSARLSLGAGAGADATLFFIVKSARLRLGIGEGPGAAGFVSTLGAFRKKGRGEFNDANFSFCPFMNSSNAAFFFSCCSIKESDDTSSALGWGTVFETNAADLSVMSAFLSRP